MGFKLTDYKCLMVDGSAYALDLLDDITGKERPESAAVFNYEDKTPRAILYHGKYVYEMPFVLYYKYIDPATVDALVVAADGTITKIEK